MACFKYLLCSLFLMMVFLDLLWYFSSQGQLRLFTSPLLGQAAILLIYSWILLLFRMCSGLQLHRSMLGWHLGAKYHCMRLGYTTCAIDSQGSVAAFPMRNRLQSLYSTINSQVVGTYMCKQAYRDTVWEWMGVERKYTGDEPEAGWWTMTASL